MFAWVVLRIIWSTGTFEWNTVGYQYGTRYGVLRCSDSIIQNRDSSRMPGYVSVSRKSHSTLNLFSKSLSCTKPNAGDHSANLTVLLRRAKRPKPTTCTHYIIGIQLKLYNTSIPHTVHSARRHSGNNCLHLWCSQIEEVGQQRSMFRWTTWSDLEQATVDTGACWRKVNILKCFR